MSADEPRAYTEEERKEMVRVDRGRGVPRCPVDGAEMAVHVQRSLGLNSNVTMRCPRCGGEVRFTRKHG
jgi:hypothetical protein